MIFLHIFTEKSKIMKNKRLIQFYLLLTITFLLISNIAIAQQKINEFSISNLYFKFADNWIVKSMSLHDNLAFHIVGEQKDNKRTSFSIILVKFVDSISSTDLIESSIEELKIKFNLSNLKQTSTYTSKLNNYTGKASDFSYVINGVQYYGKITALQTKSETLAFIKISDSKQSLLIDYEIIETTIAFK